MAVKWSSSRGKQAQSERIKMAIPPDPNRCAVQFSSSCKTITSAIVSIESLLRQLQKESGRMYKTIRFDEDEQRLIFDLEPIQGGER
ncbi:hypothetical protein [Paenibacillus dendritiformis]|uniref:hypothetical protein n=1 Tax=Paenibacillus dendritiformis TaxID=130049 RepID=UPI0011B58815|nr:hypothetical protein [Paenibacillus dendritiformis]